MLQELGFDTARPFRRTGTLTQALEGTGDMFVDIDDPLENGLLDFEDGLLDTDDDLQELDLGTAQAATLAAMPVSTGTLSQADSGTTTIKRKGRQPGSRNKKTLQREAAIAGAILQALQAGGTQAQRYEALQALQTALCKDKMVSHTGKLKMMSVLRKARSVAGQLAQRDRNGLSGALRL